MTHRVTHLLFGFVALVACSRPTSPTNAVKELVYFDSRGEVFERFGSDGVITDGNGNVIAHYANESLALASSGVLDTRQSVRVLGPRTVDVKAGAIVGHRFHVTEAGGLAATEIEEIGRTPAPDAKEVAWGRLQGYDASPAGAYRLGVMLSVASLVEPHHHAVTLSDSRGRVVERIASDGVITTSNGQVIARYDRRTKKMSIDAAVADKVDGVREADVAQYVAVHGVRTIMLRQTLTNSAEEYMIRIADDNEIMVQEVESGSGVLEVPGGRIEGYSPSLDDALQFGALVLALPLSRLPDSLVSLPLLPAPPAQPTLPHPSPLPMR